MIEYKNIFGENMSYMDDYNTFRQMEWEHKRLTGKIDAYGKSTSKNNDDKSNSINLR